MGFNYTGYPVCRKEIANIAQPDCVAKWEDRSLTVYYVLNKHRISSSVLWRYGIKIVYAAFLLSRSNISWCENLELTFLLSLEGRMVVYKMLSIGVLKCV